jgi:hypothetical protein
MPISKRHMVVNERDCNFLNNKSTEKEVLKRGFWLTKIETI